MLSACVNEVGPIARTQHACLRGFFQAGFSGLGLELGLGVPVT